ncbi:hypothetical protein SynBIOSU31_03429 [Synechococcus sp. BIOS-U3-1]|nr:hypothetical protein SynBIOSU31_03429 [Synechococcus sp. BIOS-U3-1]
MQSQRLLKRLKSLTNTIEAKPQQCNFVANATILKGPKWCN